MATSVNEPSRTEEATASSSQPLVSNAAGAGSSGLAFVDVVDAEGAITRPARLEGKTASSKLLSPLQEEEQRHLVSSPSNSGAGGGGAAAGTAADESVRSRSSWPTFDWFPSRRHRRVRATRPRQSFTSSSNATGGWWPRSWSIQSGTARFALPKPLSSLLGVSAASSTSPRRQTYQDSRQAEDERSALRTAGEAPTAVNMEDMEVLELPSAASPGDRRFSHSGRKSAWDQVEEEYKRQRAVTAQDPMKEVLDRLDQEACRDEANKRLRFAPSAWWRSLFRIRRFDNHKMESLYQQYFFNSYKSSVEIALTYLAVLTAFLLAVYYGTGGRSIVFGVLMSVLFLALLSSVCVFMRRQSAPLLLKAAIGLALATAVVIDFASEFFLSPSHSLLTCCWLTVLLIFVIYTMIPLPLCLSLAAGLTVALGHLTLTILLHAPFEIQDIYQQVRHVLFPCYLSRLRGIRWRESGKGSFTTGFLQQVGAVRSVYEGIQFRGLWLL